MFKGKETSKTCFSLCSVDTGIVMSPADLKTTCQILSTADNDVSKSTIFRSLACNNYT